MKYRDNTTCIVIMFMMLCLYASVDAVQFGFRVCNNKGLYKGNAHTGDQFTLDYQFNQQRYSCLVRAQKKFGVTVACDTDHDTPIGECDGPNFIQINSMGIDDVCMDAIIVNGKTITIKQAGVGDDSPSYKLRYTMVNGKPVKSIPAGGKTVALVEPSCAGSVENKWLLVLNQDVSKGKYFSKAIQQSGVQDKANPKSATFSIVGALNKNDYLVNGEYNLRMVYNNGQPLSNGKTFDKSWSQTSWLMDSKITGSSLGEYDGKAYDFHGLGLSDQTRPTLLDGTAKHSSYWWYAAGSTEAWRGGIPAVQKESGIAKSVRVYVCTGYCDDDTDVMECPMDANNKLNCPRREEKKCSAFDIDHFLLDCSDEFNSNEMEIESIQEQLSSMDADISKAVADKLKPFNAQIASVKSNLQKTSASLTNQIKSANAAYKKADAGLNTKVDGVKTSLTNTLNSAKTALQKADTALDKKVVALTSALKSAKSESQSADNALGKKVDGVKSSLTSSINSAKSALQKADADLNKKVDGVKTSLTNALKAAKSESQSADSALGKKVDGVKSSLTSSLNSAKSALQKADTALSSKVSALQKADTALGNRVSGVDKKVNGVKAALNKKVDAMSKTLEKRIAEIQEHLDALGATFGGSSAQSAPMDVLHYNYPPQNAFGSSQDLMIVCLVIFNIGTVLGCVSCLFWAKQKNKAQVQAFV